MGVNTTTQQPVQEDPNQQSKTVSEILKERQPKVIAFFIDDQPIPSVKDIATQTSNQSGVFSIALVPHLDSTEKLHNPGNLDKWKAAFIEALKYAYENNIKVLLFADQDIKGYDGKTLSMLLPEIDIEITNSYPELAGLISERKPSLVTLYTLSKIQPDSGTVFIYNNSSFLDTYSSREYHLGKANTRAGAEIIIGPRIEQAINDALKGYKPDEQ